MNSYPSYSEAEISRLQEKFSSYYLTLAAAEPWVERCKQAVFTASSIDELKRYVKYVIENAAQGKQEFAEEALHVALPLTYRVALDDTSEDERLAARLQDVACRALMPKFYRALVDSVEDMIRMSLELPFANLSEVLAEAIRVAKSLGTQVYPGCTVYGRVKKHVSIFLKFFRYIQGSKVPKGEYAGLSGQQLAGSFLTYLCWKLDDKELPNGHGTLTRQDIQDLIPDLLGLTIQYDEDFANGKLGIARRKYQKVVQRVHDHPDLDVNRGPFFSRHWHMNRLSLHALYHTGSQVGVPTEILVRTDLDYFLGYANYWRYKEVHVLDVPGSERPSRRERLVSRLRECRAFQEVQEMILKDLQSGQLLLF